jgi:plasmid maintenance system antidote protein VapI
MEQIAIARHGEMFNPAHPGEITKDGISAGMLLRIQVTYDLWHARKNLDLIAVRQLALVD